MCIYFLSMHNNTPSSSINDLLPKTGTTLPNSILCKIRRKPVLDKDGNNPEVRGADARSW